MLRLKIPPSTGVLLLPLLPLRAVPIAALRRCIPTNTLHRQGIIRRAFPATNAFESIQRKNQRQATRMELRRRKNAYVKFTIRDMFFLSHESACFAPMDLAQHRKTMSTQDGQIRPCVPHPFLHASSSERIGLAINGNNGRADFRKLIESAAGKFCTRLSRSHDPNR
jgi:hypothetical protein